MSKNAKNPAKGKGQTSMFSFFSRKSAPSAPSGKGTPKGVQGQSKGKVPTPPMGNAAKNPAPTPVTLPKTVDASAASVSNTSSSAKRSFAEYLDAPSVGSKVKIFWPKDKEWYTCTVYDWRKDEGTHLVKYEDGETEWVRFKDEKYELLPKDPVAAKKPKTAQAAEPMEEEHEEAANESVANSRPRRSTRSRRSVALKKPKYVFSDSDDESEDEAVPAAKRGGGPKKRVLADDEDEEEYTLSDTEVKANEEAEEDDEDDIGEDDVDDDDSWIVNDDEEEEEAKPKKRRRAPAKKKGTASSSRKGSSKTPAPRGRDVQEAVESVLTFSRSGSGKADIMMRATAALGQPPNDKDAGKLPYNLGEHWHDYQKWLYEDRRDGRGRAPSDPCFDPRTIKMPRDWAKTIAVNGGKLTPAQKQWWDFKRNNFDCVLFFKVGKFYELFHMDSDVGVKELSVGASPMIFMRGAQGHSGFPEISYGKFASMLVAKGYRVMRIEQTERPAELDAWNKGKSASQKRKVVERTVCAVLTPGTRTSGTMDGPWAKDAEQSILLAITERPVGRSTDSTATDACEYGVFFGDSQTSSFRIGQFVDDKQRNRLRTLLASVRPREVVFPNAPEGMEGGLSEETHRILKAECHPQCLMTGLNVVDQLWTADKTLQELKARFDIIHQHEAEDGMEPPFNVHGRTSSGGDPLWRWPGILHELATVSGATNTVAPAGRCQLAIVALGGALQHMRRCLVETQVFEKGTFYPYVPVDLQEAPAEKAVAAAPAEGHNKFMVLDSHSLRNLEINENTYDKSLDGSLLEFLDHCVTPSGKRLFLSWVLAPLGNVSKINARLDAVDVLMKGSEAVDDARVKMKSIKHDMERLLASVHSLGSRYLARDHPMARAIMYEEDKYLMFKTRDYNSLLRGLKEASGVVKRISAGLRACGGSKSSLLCSILPIDDASEDGESNVLESSAVGVGVGLGMASRSIENRGRCAFPSDIDQLLAAAMEECPSDPSSIKPKPGTDARYDELVREKKQLRTNMDEFLRSVKSSVSRDACYWGKGKNRFQMEVREDCKVPSSWQFNSKKKGFKRYYTKETLRWKARIEENEEATEERCRDALRLVFRRFSRHYDKWMAAIQCLSQLDALMSLALSSEKAREGADGLMDLPVARPEFVDATDGQKAVLELRDARHPCVAKTFSGNGFIANDTVLAGSGAQEKSTSNPGAHVMLLTGPNMGGKSTLLRQTCICVIMAQIGCYVPARKCRLTPVDRIFTRIGASDRILEGQSTFFVELSETSTILNHATDKSLVILDELGRGTSTFDGVAIASAVVEKICTDIKCRTIFATHYHNLVEDYRQHPDVSLGNMTCMLKGSADDEAGAQVTFLYSLRGGSCDDSYGLNVARLANLPAEILKRANQKSSEFVKMVDQKASRGVHRATALKLLEDMAATMKRKESGEDVSDDLLKLWERAKNLLKQ